MATALFSLPQNDHLPPPFNSTRQAQMPERFGFLKKLSRKPSEKHATPDAEGRTTSNNLFSRSPATRRPDRAGMNAFTTPSNEPPPAYSAAPDSAPMQNNPSISMNRSASTPHTATSEQADDPYAFLSTFDTVFLIDDSGSMAGRSWRECASAIASITPICTSHDKDGIDIHFLNSPDSPHHRNVTLASTVQEIFSSVRPSGGTPTGQRLNQILKPYLRDLEEQDQRKKRGGLAAQTAHEVKPLNVIVVTDGVPSDDVESVLLRAAQKLDALDAEPWQLGVQFVQVGEEQGAKEHLEGLDDDLSSLGKGCRDIVDTVPFVQGQGLTAETILKVVLGAVNKRLDRRRNARS